MTTPRDHLAPGGQPRRPLQPATRTDGQRFIDQAFEDRISWTAARVLLERALPILEELADASMHRPAGTADVIESIGRFLERHPAPPRAAGGAIRPGEHVEVGADELVVVPTADGRSFEPAPGTGPTLMQAGGLAWEVPAGYTFGNVGQCRSCAAPIAWCTTAAGRRAPLNPDGTSHFATCPQAESWRKQP